jgi:hypothetical protein
MTARNAPLARFFAKGIDDQTLLPNETMILARLEHRAGRRIVSISAGDANLPQYQGDTYIDAATAERLGAWLTHAGLTAQLLEAGWTLAPPGAEGTNASEPEWWMPPERDQVFTLDEAIEAMRTRRGGGAR